MSCVFCNSVDNLNTKFTITVEVENSQKKVDVEICDIHAEEATVKTAKEAYMLRQSQIDEVMRRAKELGLNLVDNGSLTIATAPSVNRQSTIKQQEIIIEAEESELVATDIIDSKPGIVTQASKDAESYSSNDLSAIARELPKDALKGKAKLGVAEGRGGQQLVVVEQRIDGLGITNIKVDKSMNDDLLQKRFKRMAELSMNGQFRDNGVRDCPICGGSGEVRQSSTISICPKCKGSGMIDVIL